MLEAVLANKSFDMAKLLKPMIQILFQIIERFRVDDNFDGDFLRTKRQAARLLDFLVARAESKEYPNLKFEMFYTMLCRLYEDHIVEGKPVPIDGYTMFGYVCTMRHMNVEIRKHLVLKELPKIVQRLQFRQATYQNSPRQLEAVQQSLLLL